MNTSPNHSEPYLNYGKFWNAMRLSFLSHFHLPTYVGLALGLLPKESLRGGRGTKDFGIDFFCKLHHMKWIDAVSPGNAVT